VLSRLSLQGFEELLVRASDYETKRKNSEQDRIFSYDKPNKYRSDISNIAYCLLNNATLPQQSHQLPEIMRRLFDGAAISLQTAQNSVDKYAADIINRNEVKSKLFSFNSKLLSGCSS
jgi:hypothetical protein